jgi:hypothetical protein
VTHTCIPAEKAERNEILADGCARCAEHAEAPWFSVDPETFRRLLARALAWENGQGEEPANDTERIAAQRILDTLNAVRAMFGLPSRDAVIERLS